MPDKRILPEDVEKQIAAMYHAGEKVDKILLLYGISTNLMYSILGRQGITRLRKRCRNSKFKRQMSNRYIDRMCRAERMEYTDLAEKIGLTHEQMYFILYGYAQMTPSIARKIADATGWDVEKIGA